MRVVVGTWSEILNIRFSKLDLNVMVVCVCVRPSRRSESGAMCYVLCAMCYVLCAMCYVLCAMCYVLCAMCYVLYAMCYVLYG
jgi:hypothetical protein